MAGSGAFTVGTTPTSTVTKGAAMAADLVLTPGGYRSRALVHKLEPGQALQHTSDNRLRLLQALTRSIVRDIPDAALLPGDVPGFGTGWITYSSWTNNTGIPVSSFETRWQVPPAPRTSSGQTIFLFNGIDPADPSAAILQPVLQWGESFAGGGPYWSVASWYVLGTGQAFHTNLVPVSEGDLLVGMMSLTGSANGAFDYTSEFQGIPGTSLPVQNAPELVWCNETLEAYGITLCSDYPDTDVTSMTSINLRAGNTTPAVNWMPADRVTDCGQHAQVLMNSGSNGEVDLFYREPHKSLDLGHFSKSVRILMGVENDGGGFVILPNGHIVRVPPHNPVGPLLREIAEGLADVGRGFAIQDAAAGTMLESAIHSIRGTALDLMANGLRRSMQAVDKAR